MAAATGCLAPIANAQWVPNGTLVAPSSNEQKQLASTSDGNGGTIVAWVESRGATQQDVYVQRASGAGVLLWNAGGVALCTEAGDQSDPAIAGDGNGGAIVTWVDRRSGAPRVYLQRVRANGVTTWTTNGISASASASANQLDPDIVGDGGFGAFVVWEYYEVGNGDLRLQQIDSSGTRLYVTDPVGVPINTEPKDSREPRITRDGVGMPVIVWRNLEAGGSKLRAQRLAGAFNLEWGTAGREVSKASGSGHQSQVRIVPIGSDMTAYAWRDSSTGDAGQIRASLLNVSGNFVWDDTGVPVCLANGAQRDPVLVPDATGGVIICWGDSRGPASDIYAQRVSAAGTVQWAGNGVPITTLSGAQVSPTMVTDGVGGAIVGWADHSAGSGGVSAQRLNASGGPLWAGGVALSVETLLPDAFPSLVPDGASGAVAAWAGAGIGAWPNARAQRVLAAGVVIPNFITASAGANGTISPAGSIPVSQGASQAFTMTPSPFYRVADVLVDDVSVGAQASYTFQNVTADHEIHATFEPDPIVVTASAGPNGAILPAGATQYSPLANATYTITPASGYGVQNVLVDGVSVGALTAYTFVGLSASHTITATFAPGWTANGRLIAPSDSAQSSFVVAGDGAGGSIVAWVDSRGGPQTDIYVQRVSPVGVPVWADGGVPLCTASGAQDDPAIAGDGAGGAIVTWVDRRGAQPRLYAQRVRPNGVPVWAFDGVTVSTAATAAQLNPDITGNGASGAYIAWESLTGGNADLLMQHLDSTGTRTYAGNGGLGASVAVSGDSRQPRIVRDDDGLPVIAWTDVGSIPSTIWAQKVRADWSVHWSKAIASSPNHQSQVRVVALGTDGTAYVWRDSSAADPGSIHARKFGLSGQQQWGGSGLVVCGAPGAQRDPVLTRDGAGGIIVAWGDSRNGASDIYAQRVLSGGVVWTANGVAVAMDAGAQMSPSIVPDGSGGAIITWADTTVGVDSIAAQRLNAAGVLQWPTAGVQLYQGNLPVDGGPACVGDGTGGAAATWVGAGAGAMPNIRIQRVTGTGLVVPRTITASAGAGGAISPAGPVVIASGSAPTFTITPSPYHHIIDVLIDGNSVGPVPSYLFPPVTADHTIHATFASDTFTITSSAGPNGSISPSGEVSVLPLANVTFTITPAPGYAIESVLVDEAPVGAISSRTFSDVDANHTISATFAEAWTLNGRMLAPSAFVQSAPVATSDGAGGTIVAWVDSRAGSHTDIYVQRVNGQGISQWTTGGMPACLASGDQDDPAIAGDGAGGAIVTWVDRRGGSPRIYAQRLDSLGAVVWVDDGVTVSASAGAGADQLNPDVAYRGSFGALVVWEYHLNSNRTGLRVQGLDANGARAATDVLGASVDTSTTGKGRDPRIIRDSADAPVIAWTNIDDGSVRAQRMLSDWTRDWDQAGLELGTAAGVVESQVRVVGFGTGTAYVWRESSGTDPGNLRVQSVNSNGSRGWGSQGKVLCRSPGLQQDPVLVADGTSGLMVAWVDLRSGLGDIRARRTNSSGDTTMVAPHGVGVATLAGSQVAPAIVSDGFGGAIIAWADETPGSTAVAAQRVSSTEALPWPSPAPVYSGPMAGGSRPTLVSDGTSGAVAAWSGAGSGSEPNIRAQRVIAGGFVVPHTITASAGPNGTISFPGATQVSEGASRTYTITPNAHHHIADVVVDGASVGVVAETTFTNVVADHTIAATFAPNVYTITASAGSNGTISPVGAVLVAALTNATFTITPDYGYVIQDVVVNGMSRGALAETTFASVTANHTIVASFLKFTWPAESLVVAMASGNRRDLVAISDGAGGTIFAWGDTRNQGEGVYVQRVGPDGTGDWAANGVRVVTTTDWDTNNDALVLVSDGAGGALVACAGQHVTGIQVRRISPLGQVLWSSSATLSAGNPFQAVSDGAGGLWLARGTQVQHMDAAGNAPAGPLLAFPATPRILSDGAGGVFAAWSTDSLPSDGDTEVHVQRFAANGTPLWPRGHRLTTAVGHQTVAGVASDGAGGLIVLWTDVLADELWAGRVASDGLLLWPFDGVLVMSGQQALPRVENGVYDLRLLGDGAQGILLAHHSTHNHVVAQRVSGDGDYMWTIQGRILSTNSNDAPALAPDEASGAMVFWTESGGSGDIRGQHVGSDGTLVWNGSFVVIADGNDAENTPAAASDGEAGAVIGWLENPSGSPSEFHCHARRILFQGQFGSPAHRITASATTFGRIAPSGVVGLVPGSNLTFTVSPDPSCRIVDVVVDGNSQGPDPTHTFTNVQVDHEISASFEQILHTVSASAGPGGIISPAGSESVVQGEGRTYAVLPNDGYRVGAFVVDGQSQGPISTYTLAGISAPHTISVTFVRDTTLDVGGWAADGRVVHSTHLGQSGGTQVPDGSGGAFVVWVETGAFVGSQLRVQRFDAGGRPLWQVAGVPLTTDSKVFTTIPAASSDGLGGLAVCWTQKSTGTRSVVRYQRVDPAGQIQLADGGLLLDNDANRVTRPLLQPLESGSVAVAWGENDGDRLMIAAMGPSGLEAGPSQKPHKAGGLTPVIAYGGNHSFFVGMGNEIRRYRNTLNEILGAIELSSTASSPTLVAAPDSSVIAVWIDTRNGNSDVYAQRVLSSGLEVWGAGDVPVSTAPSTQSDIAVAPDGEGGVLVSWTDTASPTLVNLYAQRLNSLGQPLWTTNGVPVSTATGPQRLVRIDRDGSGGAYVIWRDSRGTGGPGADTTDADIYVQRLNRTGGALWTPNGERLGSALGYADVPAISVTPAGSAVASWQDDQQVLVQRISPEGKQGYDHKVLASTTPNGTISPSGSVGVFASSSQEFAIRAAPNWRVRDVLVNGISQGAVSTVQIDGITTDQHIQVLIAPAALAGDTTSHLVSLFDFQDPDGTCRTRGWAGEDLVAKVFAHVSDRFVENAGDIAMGTRALWVGADSTVAPEETGGWVHGTGFGNNWSQRIVSPEFPFDTSAVLRFDATLDLADSGGLVSGDFGNEFLGVQALHPDSHWVFLATHFTPNGGATFTGTRVAGRGVFSAQTFLGADGNDGLGLGSTTRLRVVVQTDSAGSSEDGGVGPGRGAALIDNLLLTANGGEIVPMVDFEDDTIGAWTLAAQNGPILTPGLNPSITRDTPPPATQIALRTGFDIDDLSCAWAFVSAGDSLPPGVYARLTSPWLPLADREDDWALGFAGRFPTLDHRRVVQVMVRGKDVDHERPRFVSRLGTWVRNAVAGGDLAAPFDTLREYRYQGEFLDPQPADSIQLVFLVEDRGELDVGGLTGRPATRLPVIDRVYVTQLAADLDGDGVADNFDTCPNSSAVGQDADGDGCIDPTATFRHVETWDPERLPVKYTISERGVPGILDSTGIHAIYEAFEAWRAVDGANVPFQREAFSSDTSSSPVDGVNLITFHDAEFKFPYGVIAIAPTTSFTRRASFGDRIVQPGQIVDSDVIFNPVYRFRTSGGPADGFDLRSVATHEIGHMLGLTHSGVQTATMFPVLQPDTLASSLANDDRAAIAAAYPDSDRAGFFGTVLGTVTYAGTNLPVPGAAVYAVRVGVGVLADTVASDFTREDGAYALRRLLAGEWYSIRVAPLDGLVPGLEPGSISARVHQIARTDFVPEWWSGAAEDTETEDARDSIFVTGGNTANGVNIVTNPDTEPPTVVSIQPAPGSTNINTDTAIRINFSERVNVESLARSALYFRIEGRTNKLGGHLQPMEGGRSAVFVPTLPLLPDTTYELRITTDLTDRNGVPLALPVVSTFETAATSAVSAISMSPSIAPIGGLVTITGAGFDPQDPASNRVQFTLCPTCPSEETPALVVTPRSITAAVPASAVSGPVAVLVGESGSAPGPVLIVADTTTLAPPTPLGSAVNVGGPPSDVAVSPDGTLGVAVGRHGLVIIPLVPQGLPALYQISASHQVVVSLDNQHAWVTQPDSSRVLGVRLKVDAGSVRDTIPIEGVPEAIALSPDGRRAVVTDAGAPLLHLLDVDDGSETYGAVLSTFEIPYPGTSRGVAFEPSGRFILVGREDAGLVALDVATRTWKVVNPGTPSGGVATHPDGRQLLAAGEDGLLTASGNPAAGTLDPGASVLASPLRDVVVTPNGRCAVVISSILDRVALVDLDATSPTYGTDVASAPTGQAPVAVALSADGSVGLVANAGDGTVTVIGFGGSTTLSHLAPDAGAPGDLIAAIGSGSLFVPGTKVDVADDMGTATHTVGSAVAFRVPDKDAQPSTVTLAPPAAERSLSLPFSVLARSGDFSPSRTSFSVEPPLAGCMSESGFRRAERLVVSPDGRLLAALESATALTGCALMPAVSAFEATDRGSEPLGSHRWTVSLPMTPTSATFDMTGQRLWVAMHDGVAGMVRVFKSDDGSEVSTLPMGTVGRVDEIAADPLGRHLYLSSNLDQRILLVTPAGTVTATIDMNGFPPVAIAASREGRYLSAATADRLRFYDAATGASITSTPALPGFAPSRLVVPSGGRWLVAHDRAHRLGIWKFGENADSLGANLFLGPVFAAGDSLLAMSPAALGTAVIASLVGGDSLYQIDAAALGTQPAPAIKRARVPIRSRWLARSADGRRQWSLSASGAAPPSVADSIHLLAFEKPTHLVLVSGGGQSALAGTPVATPIRMKVTNASGRSIPGQVVRFEASNGGSGGIDGEPPGTVVHRITNARGEVAVSWTVPNDLGDVTLDVRVAGSEVEPVTVVATSVASDAIAAPQVLTTGPTDGAVGIDPGTRILVRFSQRMDFASVTSNLTLHAAGSPVAGTFEAHEDGRVMLFRPGQQLPFGASCTITMAAGALDLEGQALAAPRVVNFTIGPAPPLAITAITPRAANGKAPLVISGRGFSRVPAENQVLFNGRPARVRTASDNALAVSVPEDAVTGEIWVVVKNVPSNRVHFQRLYSDPLTPVVYGTGTTGGGHRSAALSPDGTIAYLTQPELNTLEVVRVSDLAVLDVIPVGKQPTALAVLASPPRVYVLNRQSRNVSVVDISPGSPPEVIETFDVAENPRDIAVSPVGPKVFIASGGVDGVEIFERPEGASHHHVVTVVKTGSGTKGVAVATDGGQLVVTTGEGIRIVDLAPLATGGDLVVTIVKTGSGTKGVAVATDGGMALVLNGSGQIFMISLRPGKDQYSILDTLEVDESAKGLTFTPDGGHVMVAVQDQGSITFARIELTFSDESSTSDHGGSALTVSEQEVDIGEAPSGVAIDPFGAFALVTDESKGRLTLLGLETAQPIDAQFLLDIDTVDLGVGFPWIQGSIELPLPGTPATIDQDSVRLAGTVPADTSRGTAVADADLDGRSELVMSFRRAALDAVLPVGPLVIAPCTGRSHGRAFLGRDTLTVRRGSITSPAAAMAVPPEQPFIVQYSVAANPSASSVRLLESRDAGRTWSLVGSSAPNTGSLSWNAGAVADSVVLAVVQVDAVLGDSLVRGVVGMSGVFRVGATTDAETPPLVLEFSPLRPNPAHGEIVMRFGLPNRAHVQLELYDIQGRRIATLVDGVLPAGWHHARWEGRIGRHGRAGAGVYFARFTAEGRAFRQRLVWLN